MSLALAPMVGRLHSAYGRVCNAMRGLTIATLAGVSPMLLNCTVVAPVGGGDRIVSIDYCADQMVLGLVNRSRIAAVSAEADSDLDFSSPLARGLPRVRPSLEQILAMRPTMVVRSYAGGPQLESALRRAGVAVYTLNYSATVADVDGAMTSAGVALDAQSAATRRSDSWHSSVARARVLPRSTMAALYVTPGDVTTGPDSFVAELIRTAGYRNYVTRNGWHRLPIEVMVGKAPDIVVRGFFGATANQQDRWSSALHSEFVRVTRDVPAIELSGSDLACGNWLAGRALDQMVAQRNRAGT